MTIGSSAFSQHCLLSAGDSRTARAFSVHVAAEQRLFAQLFARSIGSNAFRRQNNVCLLATWSRDVEGGCPVHLSAVCSVHLPAVCSLLGRGMWRGVLSQFASCLLGD